MGDRVYVRITCRRADAEQFRELGFVDDAIEGVTTVSMVDDEANYAHHAALIARAQAGVVFFGWHEAGCEYDPALFVSDGAGEYREVLSTPSESLALVRVYPDGTLVKGDLDRVRDYYSALTLARAVLGLAEAGPG